MHELTIIKNISYIPAFLIGAGLDVQAIGILALLMIVDTLFGVLQSGTLRGWSSITSGRFWRGIISKMMILFVPSVILLAGKGSGLDFTVLVQGTVTLLILSELYSIIGHVYSVRTGKQTTEFDAVAFVLLKLRDILKQFVEGGNGPKKL